MSKNIFSFVFISIFLFNNCTIDEEYTFKERITGKWAFSGRTAFLNDDSSVQNLPIDICEFQTEFTLKEDGTLNYIDFKQKEINDGSVDVCEENLLTKEEGTWTISPSEKLRIVLKNNEDGSDIIIAPYEVVVLNEDKLNIRYNELESAENPSISYYIYHYFRIYN